MTFLFLAALHDPTSFIIFHFYGPGHLYSQGATWSTIFISYLANLPYPVDPYNVSRRAQPGPLTRSTTPSSSITAIAAECRARFDAEIAEALPGVRVGNVPLDLQNEFGVYRGTSTQTKIKKSRLAWIH